MSLRTQPTLQSVGTSVGASTSSTVAAIGDSYIARTFITLTNSAATIDHSPLLWGNALMGQRARLVNVTGYSGQQTAYILANGVPAVLALNPRPGWCLVEGGVNDIGSQTVATITANLQKTYDQLAAAGIRVIAVTVVANNSWTAANVKDRDAVNQWIMDYASSRPGIVVCDWAKYVIDPSTGMWLSGYNNSSDLVHPNQLGAYWMGKALSEALSPLLPAADMLPLGGATSPNGGNLLTNGRFTGNTSGVATSWTLSTAGVATFSKVARSDGVAGEWQQVAQTGSGLVQLYQKNANVGTDWNIGDTLYGLAEVQVDSNFTGANRLALNVGQEGGTNDAAWWGYPGSTQTGDLTSSYGFAPSGTIVLRTPPFTVTSSAARVTWQLTMNGTGTLRVGRAMLAKVQPNTVRWAA